MSCHLEIERMGKENPIKKTLIGDDVDVSKLKEANELIIFLQVNCFFFFLFF